MVMIEELVGNGALAPVHWPEATIRKVHKLMADNAKVIDADILSASGVMHVIDTVVLSNMQSWFRLSSVE
jgi:uncharacterized surface protein with fasciclin (FAS1) repeats